MLWHILTVPPQREFKAAEALASIAASVMLPVEYRWHDARKQGGPKKAKTEKVVKAHPLWPRYVFAGFTNFVPWHQLYNLHSGGSQLITGALYHNGMPYALSNVERLAVRSLCDIEAPRVPPDAAPRLAVGDKVRINGGPYAGRLAIVTKLKGNRTHVDFLEALFGSLTEAKVPVNMVEAA